MYTGRQKKGCTFTYRKRDVLNLRQKKGCTDKRQRDVLTKDRQRDVLTDIIS